MSPKLSLLALAALSIPLATGCAKAMAQDTKDPARSAGQGVELTVYADDFAMVRETRHVQLSSGRGKLGIEGVPKTLDQNSILFTWPKGTDAAIVASTYDLGVGSGGRLLERFLGREIELVYRSQDGQPGERVRGILEVADPGNVVVRAGDRYIVNPNAQIEAPVKGDGSDSGIATLPKLSIDVESKSGGPADLGVNYMTTGLGWSADYTATLAPDTDRMKLECWATVTNKTGTDFKDAKLRFVAGSPNRAVRESRVRAGAMEADAAKAMPMSGMLRREPQAATPEAMGELMAYPYEAAATIRQDQMNRVRMMGAEEVAVKRVYTVSLPPLYRDYNGLGDPNHRIAATMAIHFANAAVSGLGTPLPAGALRVFEPDAKDAARYIGAASIGDTPKDAEVSLELTNVFNVYARARQTGQRKIDKRHLARTIEVTLANEKAKAVELRLVQSYGETFKIESESTKSARLNSGLNEWRVTVPAGGETKLRYTVVLGS